MVESDVRERYGELVFETKIRENATIVQAPVVSLDIVSYDPKCNGALDYKALMGEILEKYEK
jgi:chromosome partitioning protein